ncbi:MAG: 16S rRNA (cytosine(967)-C(5))-methyltransferase RsmB [Gammaproteobacteria bacterium]|nr:16S rRNA (cytosine(967)-C(5))-methyltransferase RsmB [Gammaproteobacteria bacterium]
MGRRHPGPRAQAAQLLATFWQRKPSLTGLLATGLSGDDDPRDKALTQALCYGVIRWHDRLEAIAKALVDKPLKQRDRDIHYLFLLGFYQILYMRIPDHAVVSATVAATAELDKSWARGLVNAVLRRFLRERDALLAKVDQDPIARYAHPAWLIERLQRQRPDQWPAILDEGNRHPPMSLRVNRTVISRDEYLKLLDDHGMKAGTSPHAPDAVILEQAVNVELLPGFRDGWVSVQDVAAQLAAGALDLKPGQRVLDACAAPGGKTCHILESEPGLDSVLALDSDADRLADVRDNLDRLKLNANLLQADAGDPDGWWDGRSFDRILLDAPCSATGVIRRHPDIKYLRSEADVSALVAQQGRILEALWRTLKPGGILVYVTCSILREENEDRLTHFVHGRDDVKVRPMCGTWGNNEGIGRQILPGQDAMDGFYYARLCKLGDLDS